MLILSLLSIALLIGGLATWVIISKLKDPQDLENWQDICLADVTWEPDTDVFYAKKTETGKIKIRGFSYNYEGEAPIKQKNDAMYTQGKKDIFVLDG